MYSDNNNNLEICNIYKYKKINKYLIIVVFNYCLFELFLLIKIIIIIK